MTKLDGIKILIVDDEPDLREILYEDFVYYGAVVKTAESGNMAFALLKQEQFDVVLSDMRMPQGDGKFLAKAIIEKIKPKPLFFMYSGFNDVTNEEISDLGIAEVFNKPFQTAALIEAISKHLKNKP